MLWYMLMSSKQKKTWCVRNLFCRTLQTRCDCVSALRATRRCPADQKQATESRLAAMHVSQLANTADNVWTPTLSSFGRVDCLIERADVSDSTDQRDTTAATSGAEQTDNRWCISNWRENSRNSAHESAAADAFHKDGARAAVVIKTITSNNDRSARLTTMLNER